MRNTKQQQRTISCKLRNQRRGAVMLLVLVCLIMLLGMAAFSMDIGRITLLRTEAQNAVDSGTLAAQIRLKMDPRAVAEAEKVAKHYVRLNEVGSTLVSEGSIDVEIGKWNSDTKTFTATNVSPDSVRVFAQQGNEPYIFGKVFGLKTFGAPAEAISTGTGGVLDIMMVLDLSGSMLYEGRIAALRSAAPVFVNVIDEVGGADKIGMMGLSTNPYYHNEMNGEMYNSGLHPSAWYHVGVLESRLTTDYSHLINNVLSEDNLKAGKYNGWTGTGASLGDAVHYLMNGAEARPYAKKVIVLMTDGRANRPPGDGPGYARQMAAYAATNDVQVYTISLGNSADEDLNQDIADATDGVHFIANGKGSEALTASLTEAFQKIAGEIKSTHLVK